MIYRFGKFTVDEEKVELRRDDAVVPVEPQVFALLALLIANRDRMVSKTEIIEKIWDGRFISDAALSSRVKSARQAVGDNGRDQRWIKTVHGKGFRFVGDDVVEGGTASPATRDEAETAAPAREGRPSIAVLPFRLVGAAGPYAGVADALPHELISALSRLRWLFVIARGSSFRFRGAEPDIREVGAALGVRYVISGVVEVVGERITVTVDLADARNGGVLWGDVFSGRVDDVHEIRSRIVASVIAALEVHIPQNEAREASITAPDHLDAWAAYHLGLQHLYRFNKSDNGAATAMFERAISREPDFARAHAGLSSTHFQNAFLHYNDDLAAERTAARRAAEKAIELDPLDPFANFAMGRVSWVEQDPAAGINWLDRAVTLSPNYAQGVYAQAWADTVSGRGDGGADGIDLALALSPLDPFRYAMLGVRAFTRAMAGDEAGAARWANEAARSPGAHVLIAAIAVALNDIAGDEKLAVQWAENARSRFPGLTRADFFGAFPFADGDMRRQIDKALQKHGFA